MPDPETPRSHTSGLHPGDHVSALSPVEWNNGTDVVTVEVGVLRSLRPAHGPERFRAVLSVAAVLLVAAATQVVPRLPFPPAAPPAAAAALPGVPFDLRIGANEQRVRTALADAGPETAGVYREILAHGRQLLHFDPAANLGRGAWAELVGAIDEYTEAVGVLVPGSSSYIRDDNFSRYYERASALVEASGGSLALVVWAAGTFPKGWLQGALSRYRTPLGRSLALFSHELRREIEQRLGPDAGTRLVVAGHSFGGAVVGSAERHGLDADAVLHIASAGMGTARDPYDYPDPTRPRYSLTADGDLIGLVQGMPAPPGIGHGPDPDDFRCVASLSAGDLPSDAAARDEEGEPIGARAGAPIGGVSSHSEVFIQGSDAWQTILDVFTGAVTPPGACPPPSEPEPLRARVLPLVVSQMVTVSQCRTGGVSRPRAVRH